jgi:rhodanese-related sulfurtransferase
MSLWPPSSAVDHIEATALKEALASPQELALLDVREQGQYGEGHPFHAVNLAYSRLEFEARRLLPNRTVQMVLLDDGCGDTLVERAALRLQAMGYENVRVLKDGTQGWQAAGYTLFKGVHVPSKTFGELVEMHHHTPRITAKDLNAMIQRGDDIVVLDGRPRSEYVKMTIPGAVCCPNAELAYRLHRLAPEPSTTVVVNCAGRTRSIIGAQSLIHLTARPRIFALENGTQGWFLNDYALELNSDRFYPDVSADDGPLDEVRQKAADLTEACGVKRITADQFRHWRVDPSRTTYFFDIRTPEEFAKNPTPGAQHAEGGQLVQGTDLYVGVRRARVVLLDTDGIRAPLIASWLAQMGYETALLPSVEALSAHEFKSMLDEDLETTLLPELLPDEFCALDGPVITIDLRSSMAYRAGHLRGSVWSTRSRVRACVDAQCTLRGQASAHIVLVANDPGIAALAAGELSAAQRQRSRCIIADSATLARYGPNIDATPDHPPNADCLDYLFFVHDRHQGNKLAATQYLQWEQNLVSQLDHQERSSFKI